MMMEPRIPPYTYLCLHSSKVTQIPKGPNSISITDHWAHCPAGNLDFSYSAGVGERGPAIISHSHSVFDGDC